MANSALNSVNTKVTPQRQRTPGRTDEVKNDAGGYTFKVSDKDRLERFLILGTEGGTYYVSEANHTENNVKMLTKMVKQDERMVVDLLVKISDEGRAYSNSPALFTLAFVLVNGNDKAYAKAALPKVARTATHLYEFMGYIENLGGWGRAKRDAVANWFLGRSPESLAYQAVKYRQRNGWTLRDAMRLSHPTGVDRTVGSFILNGQVGADSPEILKGFREAQNAKSEKEVLAVLDRFQNLPWEALPTEFLKSEKIWKALFYNGQLKGQAQVRNITRLAKLGAFNDLRFASDFAAALNDEEMLRKTRLHPVNLLNAMVVYTDGQTVKSSDRWGFGRRVKNWETDSIVLDAINDAFYTSFKTIEPAGKRTLIAIDVSGSMTAKAMGTELSSAQVSAAVAMTVARTEPAHIIRGFTTSTSGYGYNSRNSSLTDLGITARTRLDDAMSKTQKHNWGGTDCSQPMIWANKNDVEIDTFVVITDNDTWAGQIKPYQALKQYRDKTGIPARLAVLGTNATDFTIADPSDKGMMDFVGFDSNAPRALSEFSAGRI